MKYITVKQLKNEAKNKRKKDPSINNHSESLNKVACSKGFKNWDDLINNTVLLQEKKQEINFYEIAQEIQSSLLNLEKILKDGGYKQISKTVEKLWFVECSYTDTSEIFFEYLSRYLDGVAYLYTQKRDTTNMSSTELLKYLINLFRTHFLIKEINYFYPILKDDYIFKDLLNNIEMDDNNLYYISTNHEEGYNIREREDDPILFDIFNQCAYYNMFFMNQLFFVEPCFNIIENKPAFNDNIGDFEYLIFIDFNVSKDKLIRLLKNKNNLTLFQKCKIFNPSNIIDNYFKSSEIKY